MKGLVSTTLSLSQLPGGAAILSVRVASADRVGRLGLLAGVGALAEGLRPSAGAFGNPTVLTDEMETGGLFGVHFE